VTELRSTCDALITSPALPADSRAVMNEALHYCVRRTWIEMSTHDVVEVERIAAWRPTREASPPWLAQVTGRRDRATAGT